MNPDEKRLLIEILRDLADAIKQIDGLIQDNGDDSQIVDHVHEKIDVLSRAFGSAA